MHDESLESEKTKQLSVISVTSCSFNPARSSYYLEDAATEFQVQGLELDWVCVAWDGDLRRNSSNDGGSGWNYHFFRGDRWCNVKKLEDQRYLQNAYRVLLTRARQGMGSTSRKGTRWIPHDRQGSMTPPTDISPKSASRS